ncbi:Blp family class II bacteriocin [Pseudoalteromonas sp. T1lg65]|uniref:Blp family class II bacteriocin n=1 Tax=Pseudoalteromonas sp. T1lg65 TaxID=2077101 RepID=UPI003F78BD29
MREINVNEIEAVNGGCAEHCWGNQSLEDTVGGAIGGAIAGARGGLGGAILGAIGGAVAVIIGNLNEN